MLEHKNAPAYRFGVPDPTIVDLEGIEYLILTVLREGETPSLCFFAIDQSEDEVLEDAAAESLSDPTFEIDGGEAFVGIGDFEG